MAIKKQFVKKKPVCKVTFQLQQRSKSRFGWRDFNNWNSAEGTLNKLNGTFKGFDVKETLLMNLNT
jgi:hypothetical protein